MLRCIHGVHKVPHTPVKGQKGLLPLFKERVEGVFRLNPGQAGSKTRVANLEGCLLSVARKVSWLVRHLLWETLWHYSLESRLGHSHLLADSLLILFLFNTADSISRLSSDFFAHSNPKKTIDPYRN